MLSPLRLRFKIVTSFAIAACAAIALARLAASVPLDGTTMLAFASGGLLLGVGAWRGWIYLRAARRGRAAPR